MFTALKQYAEQLQSEINQIQWRQYPIRTILAILRRHAWTIIFIISVCYFVKVQFIDPYLEEWRANQSYKDATNPDRVAVLTPDMRQVRERQQEITAKRSAEAAVEAKKKRAEEIKRKRVARPGEEKFRGGGTVWERKVLVES